MEDLNKEGLCQKCEPFEIYTIEDCKKLNCAYKANNENWHWDDKFGWLCDYASPRMKEQLEATNVKIAGVGQDAEIVTNKNGGKQSKSPMAMHLIDPQFLEEWAENNAQELEHIDGHNNIVVEEIELYDCYKAIQCIAEYMQDDADIFLISAIDYIEPDTLTAITKIAKVLQVGADRYEPNNWRLIPEEEHLNHALIHIIAHIAGDTQDEHLNHALCRLMMAYATDKSEDFEYSAYVNRKAA